ncbi:MAG: protein-disulfide reductase DsbD [Methylomonas sp.]|nr:protein-disulfide reductase DsbD [Methylomonas sp.]PPD20876.1 MAG: thiol:disulfide interchange protein [Methylomonas sp.]PPD26335.1 MAG: thiol:disulfide interchange protein [Methylomonas sp.]PPD38056.1 MAG: thiol:disulfide interchange protein [Methylomonas sp.]PPD40308.1 MAG: thiol:disulfide interchange protein [Methylomonas sp.]
MGRLMRCCSMIWLLACFALLSFGSGAVADDILPVEQAFKLVATGQSRDSVRLSWQIAEGHHLYRERTFVESQTDGIQLGTLVLPEGAVEHDPAFGDVMVFRDGLDVDVPLLNPGNAAVVKLLVKYQGCADRGVCYPPQKVAINVDLPADVPSPKNNGHVFDGFVKGFKNLTPGLFNSELLPPEQAFGFTAQLKDEHNLRLIWRIADGYYLYKNKFSVDFGAAETVNLPALPLPTGKPHLDEEFGQVEVYRNELVVDVPLIRQSKAAETLTLTAHYQGCADRGVCYPPMQTQVALELPEATTLPASATPMPATDAELSEQDRIVSALQQDSLWLTLLSFFGFGLLLSFTPCVFPMIPILSGIIVGQGDDITTRKAFLLSLCFVLASALMDTLFGILAALFGSNLQASFQEPWVISVFSGLFVLLSLSMFGFYELQIPSSLQERLNRSSEAHRDGSYLGAGIMGALSALIVGPCVAAPLAAALMYIGQTGDVVLGGSALFVMGFGMGVPLLVVGASAGKLLPKAGHWLDVTKSVFGVIMLAVALWMLSRVLPDGVTLFLAAMLLIVPAIFMNAVDPLPHPVSGWKKLWKGLGIAMLTFGVLQLIGLSAGNTHLLQPLAGLRLASGSQAADSPDHALNFQRIKTVADLERKVAEAKANGQRLMLDFYADWCISCKELDAYTFTDARVQAALRDFVVIQADVTANDADDRALLKHFNVVGPPAIIFYQPDGQEKTSARVIGFQNADAFLGTLRKL